MRHSAKWENQYDQCIHSLMFEKTGKLKTYSIQGK